VGHAGQRIDECTNMMRTRAKAKKGIPRSKACAITSISSRLIMSFAPCK
jgi:hypothetical protein